VSAAAGLRIGDAERAAAADRLAGHFSHGRLDQAELDERLDQAMRAKTAPELAVLFADLPPGPVPLAAAGGTVEPPKAEGPPRAPRRRRLRAILLAVLLVVAIVAVGNANALTHSFVVGALVVLVAVLWLRRRRLRNSGSPPSTP
jgi:Flp pilus assembly protein TadB